MRKTMRRTIWALPLATALGMGISIPSASAATGTITANNVYSSVDDTQTTSVNNMRVGDCTMFGTLRVGRPNAGVARVRFQFTTSTSHTNNFDQWHNSWRIFTFGRQSIASLSTIDGFRMYRTNVSYVGEIDTSISMTTSQWVNIAGADWTGSC